MYFIYHLFTLPSYKQHSYPYPLSKVSPKIYTLPPIKFPQPPFSLWFALFSLQESLWFGNSVPPPLSHSHPLISSWVNESHECMPLGPWPIQKTLCFERSWRQDSFQCPVFQQFYQSILRQNSYLLSRIPQTMTTQQAWKNHVLSVSPYHCKSFFF